MRALTLATCSLNQWALDFSGNLDRIRESIRVSKSRGAVYRLGPELEICGYGCNDHFYETDTFDHCWEVLCELLNDKSLHEIIIDVGMPVCHKSVRYNCRVLCHNGQILFIRPKLYLANDGNYRESRWFTPWLKHRSSEDYHLPQSVSQVTGQRSVKIGDLVLRCGDAVLGSEVCEELFTPQSPHITQSFDGVEVFTNGSASHHELRKLTRRLSLIQEAMRKVGGVYMYANQQGCDGERVYYDGCALISVNGHIVAQGSQFSLNDVEVVTATIDLDEVLSYRGSLISRGLQASSVQSYPYYAFDQYICKSSDSMAEITQAMEPRCYTPEQEISLGPACWLWDYLRRSGMRGFFLPLSGGIDSCSTAILVYSMCRLVYDKYTNDPQCQYHIQDVKRVIGSDDLPTSPQDLCNRILHTCYMGSSNSTQQTRERALTLSKSIGSFHMDVNIDGIVESFVSLLSAVLQFVPRYKVHGGSQAENLVLQNIQARTRMVLSYAMAQLLPLYRGREGSLLVLGSANVDECLRGYFTKYDCSSADINPIGSISKADLKSFIQYAKLEFNLPVLEDFISAVPSAELEPVTADYVQSDEADMGVTYDDLSLFGRLRKIHRLGPVSMYKHLVSQYWDGVKSVADIQQTVCKLFRFYSINRHKMTTLTPSYHAESYSPDDNRFDLRPFLYNSQWSWQFNKIKQLAQDK
ncbi:hypothetical protein MIR68_006674 [Amoeboaphelidium protococcarum]|nr:hypothetical protein MIR68_006674 [Amoeboaphelidium protococcarum]